MEDDQVSSQPSCPRIDEVLTFCVAQQNFPGEFLEQTISRADVEVAQTEPWTSRYAEYSNVWPCYSAFCEAGDLGSRPSTQLS